MDRSLSRNLIVGFLTTIALACPFGSAAQNTFTLVDNIFKSSCTLGCHNYGDFAGQLNLDGPEANVYASLVGVTPVNPNAASLGDKRVEPGYPHRSFLFRKLNNFLDDHLALALADGDPMPKNAPALAPEQIELVRQWILKGAPQNGNVVDTAVVNKYYRGQGITASPASHPLPTAPGSFQVHLGKIFLGPTSEAEYYIKHDLRLPDTLEVNRIELFMTGLAHHFIIYKLNPGTAGNFPAGLRLQNPQNGNGSSSGSNTIVSAWQTSANYDLPPTTAYRWETGTVLDLNYHLKNFNIDSVLATDIYFNVYTQPKGTAASIMYSDIITYLQVLIPPNNQNTTFTGPATWPNETNYWNIWLLSTHTHKLGIDFDIYERNQNGSLGTQLFEGFYNFNYTFNQGYYDWAHPPIRKFDPLYQLNPRWGIVQQAIYRNYTPNWVTWGLTTNDEMMLYFIQYTKGAPLTTGINEQLAAEHKLNVAPNPFNNRIDVQFSLTKAAEVGFTLTDLLGRTRWHQTPTYTPEGQHVASMETTTLDLSPGIYLLTTRIDDREITTKVIKTAD